MGRFGMARYAWLTLAILGAPLPVLADSAVPVRQGVMCISATALAILTLPNGDSRTHQASGATGLRQLADDGGCIDLAPAMQLNVYRSYHNTSLVFMRQADGARSQLYRVPNIDLKFGADPIMQPSVSPAAPPPPPPPVQATAGVATQPSDGQDDYVVRQRFRVGHDSGTIELLQDKRISPSVFNDLWRAGGNATSASRAAAAFPGGALLTARLRLTFDGSPQVQMRDLGYPLATLTPLDKDGKAFSLHVDTSDKQASRISEERLAPSTEGLTPSLKQAAYQPPDDGQEGASRPEKLRAAGDGVSHNPQMAESER